jgi:hypothetical protein
MNHEFDHGEKTMKAGRRIVLATLPLLLTAAGGCATTTHQSNLYFEPSIQRSEVHIRRIAIVPNRLPMNLADPEDWRKYNWEQASNEFRQRGFEVVDYETSVRTFEASGLPLEDTPNSRDKLADLARELNVDAIIVPYYGTLFESKQVLIMSEMHWKGVITFQVYLASANDFFARLDLGGDTAWIANYGTIFLLAASMSTPTAEYEYDPNTGGLVKKEDPTAAARTGIYMFGAFYMIADLYYALRGSKYMWRMSFKKAIQKGLEPFFVAFPAAR